jgi:hypothetical protein
MKSHKGAQGHEGAFLGHDTPRGTGAFPYIGNAPSDAPTAQGKGHGHIPALRSATGRALELEETIAARAKGNQSAGGGDQKSGLQKSAEPITPIDTRAELAAIAGVSHDTANERALAGKKIACWTTRPTSYPSRASSSELTMRSE